MRNNPGSTNRLYRVVCYQRLGIEALSIDSSNFSIGPKFMRFLPILFAATAAVTAQSPLLTTYAGGNGQSGNMFEVNALNAAGVTIRSFNVNTNSSTVGDFEVYTLAGNYAGNENNAAAWTLVGSATGVPCAGFGVATALPICVNVFVASGTTQSFYVTHSDTNIVAYTNGTAAGAVYASNADLEFIEGSGHAYPFAANFTPRVWNGEIFYDIGDTSATPCSFGDVQTYGAGCGGAGYASAYELIPSANMDLDGSIITGLNTGAGYLIQVAAGAGGIAPGLNAQIMALGDDDFQDSATVGGTLGVWVGSNCNISLGGANGNGFTPDVNAFLTQPFEGLHAWTDLHSASGGGAGDIYYEENGTEAIVTYLAVSGWNVALPNTVQFKWDTSSGNWSIEFEALNLTNPEAWLVGYSPAGNNIDPGPTDWSSLLGGGVLLTQPSDSAPLDLSGGIPKIGTPWDLTTNYIDPVSPFAITFLGAEAPIPVPFAAIGINAPGCDINLSSTLTNLISLAAGGSATAPVPIPGNPAFLGATLSAQSVSLSTANPAGLISSNGITGTVGN